MRLSMNNMRLSAIAVSLAVLPSAAMANWSAADDFSSTSNPNGPWSYGTRASELGTSLLLLSDAFASGSLAGWRDIANSASGTPVIYKNFSNSTVVSGTVTIPAQMLVMHPSYDNFGPAGAREVAVTRWTAVSSGAFDIAGSFIALDSGSTDVHVVLNGVSLFSAIRASNTTTNFSLNGVAVTAGDTIDFVVGNNGSFFNDSTGLVATIVPAPAAAAPFALVLLARRRRR
jgi:hypothetical protein